MGLLCNAEFLLWIRRCCGSLRLPVTSERTHPSICTSNPAALHESLRCYTHMDYPSGKAAFLKKYSRVADANVTHCEDEGPSNRFDLLVSAQRLQKVTCWHKCCKTMNWISDMLWFVQHSAGGHAASDPGTDPKRHDRSQERWHDLWEISLFRGCKSRIAHFNIRKKKKKRFLLFILSSLVGFVILIISCFTQIYHFINKTSQDYPNMTKLILIGSSFEKNPLYVFKVNLFPQFISHSFQEIRLK